jgi:hypothetical protein
MLRDALISHAVANDVKIRTETDFGSKFIAEGPIMSPDGRNPKVRTIWIQRVHEDDVHFVTAYPIRDESND